VHLDYGMGQTGLHTAAKITSYALIFTVWSTSLISVVYGMQRLCKSNVSQKVRRLMIARHIATILF